MNEVVGLCNICGRPSAMFSCHLCGRLVCDRCYDHRNGVCIECHHGKMHSKSQSFPFD